MMCNPRIISQRELYDKQVNKIEALSESYREAALSSRVGGSNREARRGTYKSNVPSAGN